MEGNNKQNIAHEQKPPEEKRLTDCCGKRGYNFGNLFLGLVVVFIGIFYLSKNYGWLPEDLNVEILRLWPVLIITAGLSLLDSRGFLSKTTSFVIFLIVITVTSFIIFYGFKNSPEPVFKETPFKIEIGEKTNYADIAIMSGVGKVDISGISGPLAEGNLRSDISGLKIENDASGERQKLSLETAKEGNIRSLGQTRNDLAVKLSKDLPMDISLNLGVSESRLDLREIQVNNLSIDVGITNLQLMLGDKAENLKVSLKSGLSTIKISLPDSVGAKVVSGGGLSSMQVKDLKRIDDGTYQTDNYGQAEKKIEISLDTGLSSLEIGTYKP